MQYPEDFVKMHNSAQISMEIRAFLSILGDKNELLRTMLCIPLCTLHKQEASIFCHFISRLSFIWPLYLSIEYL